MVHCGTILLHSFWTYRKNTLIGKPSNRHTTWRCWAICIIVTSIQCLYWNEKISTWREMRRGMRHTNEEGPISVDSVCKMSNRKGDGVKEMVKLGSAGRCTCWQRTLLSSIHSSPAILYEHCCGNIRPVPKRIWCCRFYLYAFSGLFLLQIPQAINTYLQEIFFLLVFFATKQTYLDTSQDGQ
jgi:hypothetical protein